MTNELLNEWKKEKIVEDGDIVLAGVSGGADSVCLLLMLEQLQKKTDFLLEAVHVEHGIRGEESRKDAAFVKCIAAFVHQLFNVGYIRLWHTICAPSVQGNQDYVFRLSFSSRRHCTESNRKQTY